MLTATSLYRLRKVLPHLAALAGLLLLSACAAGAAGQAEALAAASPLAPEAARTLTPAPSPTLAPSATPSLQPTATPTLTPTPTRPAEHYIRAITGHRQHFSLSCEAAVASDWAGYFGVTIAEFDFQFALPLSDNPEKGFVGSVNAPWGQVPPYGYGVHAPPVADLLVKYGLPARAVKGWTVEQVKDELAHDRPVIAWVIGNVEGGVPAEYTAKDGQKVIVAAYEHTIILTGYNEDHIRYMTNGRFIDLPTRVFENSWGVLGNMAIYYDGEKPGE